MMFALFHKYLKQLTIMYILIQTDNQNKGKYRWNGKQY